MQERMEVIKRNPWSTVANFHVTSVNQGWLSHFSSGNKMSRQRKGRPLKEKDTHTRGTRGVPGSSPRTGGRKIHKETKGKPQVGRAPGREGSRRRNWKHEDRDQTYSKVIKGLWKGRADSREK